MIDICVIFVVIINTYINIMEMANYIYSILRSQQIVMWSWGFNAPNALANNEGLLFHVNGFKHKGWVKIIYNGGTDLFIVILLNNNMIETIRIEDVYFDSLVEVIDEEVEHTSEYVTRVTNEYK